MIVPYALNWRNNHQRRNSEPAPATAFHHALGALSSGRTARCVGWIGTCLIASMMAVVLGSADSARAASMGVYQEGTGLTEIIADEGDTVSLVLYLDTEGESFEGYMAGIDITGGSVSGIAVAHQGLGVAPNALYPDL
ncbi:MAG: hypothetical protein VCC04_06645, partial [Myxococcota bacterium]